MVKTLNLDKPPGKGVRFRRAYCNNPVGTPSRSTMITGKTPRQHGCLTNGCVLPDQPTLPGQLAAAGYETHAVGKLHLQAFGCDCADPVSLLDVVPTVVGYAGLDPDGFDTPRLCFA